MAVPPGTAAPEAIERLLRPYPTSPPARHLAGAATTIVLRAGVEGPETLLIERTVRADDRGSGQVALPGGRVDEQDPSLEATALRELEEEVGLSAERVERPLRFVGVREASVFSVHVAIFATQLRGETAAPFPASPSEVAKVFWFPLDRLAKSDRILRPTPSGPREVEAHLFDGHVLWGFTRRVLGEFFGSIPSDGQTRNSP